MINAPQEEDSKDLMGPSTWDWDHFLRRGRPAASASVGTLTARNVRPLHDNRIFNVAVSEPWPWVTAFAARVTNCFRLPSTWAYGSPPLNPKTAIAGVELLDSLGFSGPSPLVAPSATGGLELEWVVGECSLEIEITPQLEVNVLVDQSGDVETWTTSLLGDEKLRAALERFVG